jgi:hypothetical protein
MPKSSFNSSTSGLTLHKTGATMSMYGVRLSNSLTTFLYVIVLLAFLVNLQEQSVLFYDQVDQAGLSLASECWDKDMDIAIKKSQKPACKKYFFTYTLPAMSTVLRRSMQCTFILKPLAWVLFGSEPTFETFTGSPGNHNNEERADWMWALVSLLASTDIVKVALVLLMISYVLSKILAFLVWFKPDLSFMTYFQGGTPNTTTSTHQAKFWRQKQSAARTERQEGDTEEEQDAQEEQEDQNQDE